VVEVEAAAPGEPMDINTAVQMVLKKALAHDGLSRGLHEATRAIERGEAQLCILADDCNSPDYKKLIEALCAEHNVNLISVPENKQLGQMAGVSRACCPVACPGRQPAPLPALLLHRAGVVGTRCRAPLTPLTHPHPHPHPAQLCKIDAEGEARKVVGCSCAVITDYGEETQGLQVLQEYLKSR
jgi:small subunit ribosomal protein S12e